MKAWHSDYLYMLRNVPYANWEPHTEPSSYFPFSSYVNSYTRIHIYINIHIYIFNNTSYTDLQHLLSNIQFVTFKQTNHKHMSHTNSISNLVIIKWYTLSKRNILQVIHILHIHYQEQNIMLQGSYNLFHSQSKT